MISLPRISKLAAAGEHDRLFNDLLRSLRPLPLMARARLSGGEDAPAAALALGLRRFCELTYRPTRQTADLTARLLARRRPDGSFGGPGVTALALAALLGVRRQIRLTGEASFTGPFAELESAIAGAVHALHLAQRRGLQEGRKPGLIGDEIDSALTVWQLAGLLEEPEASLIDLPLLIDACRTAGLDACRETAPLLELAEEATAVAA